MPFYQVLCIAAHNREYRQIKGLVRLAATHVLNNGGVVRGLQYWGTEVLPQRMNSHGATHERGDYWTMHFDASPEKQKSLTKLLRRDPRVIRTTVLKMGDRIEDVAWRYPKTLVTPPDVPLTP
ncbi:ribosomal protein S6 [Gloeopeniophorella convolvens]|nr:ribosomal protein S6 [Gloeopeniophorella convolvens]